MIEREGQSTECMLSICIDECHSLMIGFACDAVTLLYLMSFDNAPFVNASRFSSRPGGVKGLERSVALRCHGLSL